MNNKFLKKAELYDEDIKDILNRYKKEIYAIDGIYGIWSKLTEKARDICMRDFDEIIILREVALEQVFRLKLIECKNTLDSIDVELLKNSLAVEELFGFDVKSYLNISA